MVSVKLNSTISAPTFRSNEKIAEIPLSAAQFDAFAKQPQASAQVAPSVAPQVAPQPAPQKTGIIQGFKNAVAGFKKFFVKVDEYISGAAKGIAYGTVAAATTYAVVGLRNFTRWIRNVQVPVKEAGKAVLDAAGKEVTKRHHILPKRMGQALAVAVGVVTAGYSLYKASLNVSERTADIDHRYNTGHRTE